MRVVSSFPVELDDTYPDLKAFDPLALESCDRNYTITIVPTLDSWSLNDRTVNCIQSVWTISSPAVRSVRRYGKCSTETELGWRRPRFPLGHERQVALSKEGASTNAGELKRPSASESSVLVGQASAVKDGEHGAALGVLVRAVLFVPAENVVTGSKVVALHPHESF